MYSRCLIVILSALTLLSGGAQLQSVPSNSPGSASRPQPRNDANSLLAHQELVQKARQGGIDVYFVGDSITRRWGAAEPQYKPLLENWTTNFFGWNAANFGWGADRIENILWRLQNGELDGVNPKVIVVLAGINNVGTEPADAAKIEDITEGLKAVLAMCHAKAPDTTVILTAIFPRNDNLSVIPTISQINRNLAGMADGKRVRFLNINDKLADQEGRLVPGMMNADRLHPTLKAYQVWADALKPLLTELLGPPAKTDHAPPPTGDPSAMKQLPAQENISLQSATKEREKVAVSSSGKTNSTSPLTQQDVLSIKNGRFFLEGRPFVEISFNKYDLFWQLYDQLADGKQLNAENPSVQAQNKALRNLHELGFKTIRIFALPWGPAGPESYANTEKRKNLYAALDKTLELCDAYDIRVVWSLAAATFTDTKLESEKGWIYGEEQVRELISNPESRGRKLLYQYIDETVARYRHRKAVLMWEISNEVTLLADIGDTNRIFNGERMPSLKDVARFFDDVAKRIKSADPLRLVNSGGSNMRESQWHLHLGQGWRTDSFEDQFKCFELLYAESAVDVIDIHSYPDNKPGYAITGNDGKPMWLDNRGYTTIAKRLGKPLIIGELGLHAIARTDKTIWDETPDYFESYDDTKAAKPWVVKTLNDVIEAGVPLSYWWCYQSDNPSEHNNRQRFDIDRNRNPELLTSVVEANKRLKANLLPRP